MLNPIDFKTKFVESDLSRVGPARHDSDYDYDYDFDFDLGNPGLSSMSGIHNTCLCMYVYVSISHVYGHGV